MWPAGVGPAAAAEGGEEKLSKKDGKLVLQGGGGREQRMVLGSFVLYSLHLTGRVASSCVCRRLSPQWPITLQLETLPFHLPCSKTGSLYRKVPS